jgi:peptidoglycan/LPS O-acetylase OafA/YrhL
MPNMASGNLTLALKPKKQLYLEFVRGIVAILVFISHIVEVMPTDAQHPFLISFVGTDSVMIFFLLSGCVINISQSRKPKSKADFFINRLIRLFPQFILGVFLGMYALHALKMALPSAGGILGNFLMVSTLQGYFTKCIQTNSPIWTLTFEMFFYLLFILCIGGNTRKKIWAWFSLSLVAMIIYYFKPGTSLENQFIIILAFSSIWLIGYFVYEYRRYFYVGPYAALLSFGMLPMISRLHIFNMYYDPFNYFLFALMAVPFFRFCLHTEPSGFQVKTDYIIPFYPLLAALIYFSPDNTRISSRVLYMLLPLALVGFYYIVSILNIKDKCSNVVNKVGAVTGKYSYSLYIIHYPILNLCAGFFKNRVLYVIISLVVVTLVCYFLESIFQPAVVRFLKKKSELRAQLAS